ncbi:MAG TPA: M15 family metallopeptidase [Candidatus Saccharimonadales bacterium]
MPSNSENDKYNPSAQEAEKDLDPARLKENAAGQNASDSANELSDAENNPTGVDGQRDAASQEEAPWNTRLGGKNQKKGKGRGKMSKRNRRILLAVFMLVATSVLGMAAFFIFLPLKIVNVMENLKESASNLVERPIEKRFNYLLTRYIAGKIVAGEDTNEFDRYVCPSGGIACSVFKTWQLNRFEEKLGLTIESNRTGNGRATSWKVTTSDGTVIEGDGGNFDEIVEELTREIDGTRAMRAWLKEEVNSKTKRYNVYKRYAMRKMLMRKYGITSWRGPEKLENTYDSYTEYKQALRTKFKKTLSRVSLGRVLKLSAKLIGCLNSDSSTCKELQTDENPPPDKPEDDSGNESDKKGREAAKEGQAAIESESSDINVEDLVDEAANGSSNSDEVAKQLRKIVTKRILAAGVAGIGIIDVLADIVEKIDQGAVNAMAERKNEVAYIGYATEWATIVDKLKEGDLDPETAQVAAELIENYERSPLAQHEASLAQDLGKPGHEVERDCDEDGTIEKLQPYEYICENKKITYDHTAFITSWPAWDSVVVPIATAWNNSVGAVFDFFNAIAGGILDAVGFNRLIEWVLEITGLASLAEEVMESIVSTFLGSPITGAEEDADAYDAMSIGVKGMFNGMMKNGVDQEGNGMGAAGKALTYSELGEINNAAARDKEEDFNNQSLMARIFNPQLTGSAANTLIARLPSNFASFLHAPVANLSQLAAPSAGAYPYRNENPAGYVLYGYAENSSVFTAPPEAYTEETCKQFAAARDASYDRRDGEISPQYHLEDPCALERVVRISATAAYTDEFDDEFKLYRNQPTAQESGSFTGQPGQTITKGKGWSLQNNTDYSATTCAAGSTEEQIYTHPKNGYKIRLCKVNEGGPIVTSLVSAAVVKMVSDAKAANIALAGGGFRSYEAQIATRKANKCPDVYSSPSNACSPPTARPGESEHERGLAIDISNGGPVGISSPQFNWLQTNAAKYGFYNLPYEPWHWSTSGN